MGVMIGILIELFVLSKTSVVSCSRIDLCLAPFDGALDPIWPRRSAPLAPRHVAHRFHQQHVREYFAAVAARKEM